MDSSGLALAEPAERGRHNLTAWILGLAAVAVSMGVIWLATRELPVVLGFGGGVLALGGLALSLARRAPPLAPVELALPDWSVTVAAIARPDAAVAIIDRAGRMVCANPLFEEWFGVGHAPPRLPVDEP